MKRVINLILLSLLMLTLGATALAQEVLPLPASPETRDVRNTILLDQPVVFGAVRPGDVMSWQNIGAAKYTIKFYSFQAKETILWEPQFACWAVCFTTSEPTVVFDRWSDGHDLTWQVTAKLNGVKYKSEARRAALNEVDTPALLSPNHAASLPLNEITEFKWHKPDLAVKYTLIVKEYNTKAVVLKKTISIATDCWTAYPYDQCHYVFGGANPTVQQVLQPNAHYIWFVKVVGPTGEKAGSNKFHLLTE